MKSEEWRIFVSLFFFLCTSLVKQCLSTGKILTLYVSFWQEEHGSFPNATRYVGKHNVSRVHFRHVKLTDESRRNLRNIVRCLTPWCYSMVFCLLCVLKYLVVTPWFPMHIRFKRISRVWDSKVPHEQKQAVRERHDEKLLTKTKRTCFKKNTNYH